MRMQIMACIYLFMCGVAIGQISIWGPWTNALPAACLALAAAVYLTAPSLPPNPDARSGGGEEAR